MTVPLLAAARAFAAAGCSVVPVRTDGTKAPAPFWKQQQLARANDDQLRAWFATDTYDGLGVVCGRVSGQLEMLEWEGRAVTDGLLDRGKALLADHGMTELWDRLTAGYVELTPSGGVHLLYRVDGDAAPNRKIARRPSTDNELAANPAQKVQVLIETRGEGGFTVTAPSHGRSHPTGKPWLAITGTAATIPTISVDERDALHAVLSLLDQMPVEDGGGKTSGNTTANVTPGDRPGDDYNVRASWADILTPHGWTVATRVGDGYGWRRPGKTGPGISATTGTRGDVDRLYVFSTSTAFDPEKPYSKFAAYALLEHGGDYHAAAKALRAAGYGRLGLAEPHRDLAHLVTPLAVQPTPAPSAAATVTAAAAAPPGPDTYSRTDDGNALRFIDTHHTDLRYVPQRSQWLVWDGARWRWDHAGAVHELARHIARDLPATDRADILHRQSSLSRRGVEAMVALARTDPRIVTLTNRLDARPYDLNTPAGVLDLRAGTIRPPDRDALHTRSTTVAPDFDTEPTGWLRFLADTFAGDPALTTYVQRLLGVSLVGCVLEQILPFAYGEGANGKTTLLGVVQRLIGLGDDGYAISAGAELLLATHAQGHPTELARLAGARLVVTSELEEGQRFAEARVKQLTGRDPIGARFIRENFFTFTPTHTLWLLANHEPAVRSGGPAFWRRLRKLPFLHTVPKDQRDPNLEETLIAKEGPAILAWLARGAADYFRDGLSEPDSVRVATAAYERDQDTVARFVEERCAVGPATSPGIAVRVPDLRQAYETWCRVEGENPLSAKALTLALRSRYGVLSERTPQARMYLGIRLDEASSDPSSDPSSEAEDDRQWWAQ